MRFLCRGFWGFVANKQTAVHVACKKGLIDLIDRFKYPFRDSLKHKIVQHLNSNLQHFGVYSEVYIHHKTRKNARATRVYVHLSALQLFGFFAFLVFRCMSTSARK